MPSLIDKLEEIVEAEACAAEEKGFRRGHWDGYWKGIALTLLATTIANFFLLSPLLSQKLFPFVTPNFTQCLTVRPEQACRTYCNSPTFLA
jgi:hypothetical protein